MSTKMDASGALVPADIFQVLIVDGGGLPPLPETVERNIRWAQEAHPGARHHLLSGDDIRSLLAADFDTDVLAAYDRLAPYSFRSDLARFCLLYKHGGLYADIGVRCVSELRGPRNAGIVGFRDYWLTGKHGPNIACGLLLARAGRPELKTAIDMVTANVRSGYYGAGAIDVTGPALFARAISHHHDVGSYWFGQFVPVAAETRFKNFVFLTPDGEIVALGKSGPGGDLSYLGLSGVNDYVGLWRARRAYGETRQIWPHDALQLNTEIGVRGADGLGYAPPHRGFVLYGPSCPLAPGAYRAVLRFASGSSVAYCSFDVAFAAGTKQAARIPYDAGEIEDDSIALAFSLETPQNDLECRMWTDGRAEGRILELEIEPA